MNPTYTLGPDVDLDHEIVRDRQGKRITETRAAQIAADALHQAGVGRPSLTGPGQRSPEVKARVPAELRDRLHETADQRGVSASELVREALEDYLAS